MGLQLFFLAKRMKLLGAAGGTGRVRRGAAFAFLALLVLFTAHGSAHRVSAAGRGVLGEHDSS